MTELGKPGKCRTCGAAVLWVQLLNKRGEYKTHPLDFKSTGKTIVRFGSTGRRAKIVDGYTSHFATCPDASEHRAKPKARAPATHDPREENGNFPGSYEP